MAAGATGQTNAPSQKESKREHDARMQWWRDARFGMFIHWGLYAVPGGEWNGEKGHAEWIRDTAKIPLATYQGFVPRFNPTKFDANAWARMAKQAGMKYVVITTKHHDGFGLFDSKHTDFDIMATPYRRDVMRALSTAVRGEGLKMGWYHSIMDWHHPDYLPRRSWEVAERPAGDANFDRFNAYLHRQVTELLTNYGDIGVMWFDGEWESTWNNAYGKALYDLCRRLQPNVIVNNRVANSRGGMESYGVKADQIGDFTTPEQFIPPTGLPGVDWETCMTMNDYWGWNKNDRNWKSSSQLIRNLVDVASKGGNYLLNIGPTETGEFPSEAVQRLKDIGDWMRINGESIYGTQASVFEALPWGRSTTKRGEVLSRLYLQVFDWPRDGRLVVPGLANRVRGASVLGRRGRLDVSREGGDVVVGVRNVQPSPVCTVVALDVEGAPTVYRQPKILAPTDMILDTMRVTIDPVDRGVVVRYSLDGSNPSAASPVYSDGFDISGKSGDVTVSAASFVGGRRVSGVSRFTARRAVVSPAVAVTNLVPGLQMEEYVGDWERIPNFATLRPTSSSVVREIVAPSGREKIGRRYTGYLSAPMDDVYRFAFTSDDGGRLWIDGKPVADLDGLHPAETKTFSLALAKGAHEVRVEWFNRTGGSSLGLQWARLGEELRPVSGESLGHLPTR
jgi:alpha-L-fucosidase